MIVDLGMKRTDIRVERIRRELAKIYTEAADDLHKKARDYLQRHYEMDKKKRADLSAGKITKEQYRRWQSGQVFIGKQWESKIRQMAHELVNIEKEAVDIVNGEQVECFADNANYIEFRIDKDMGFGVNFGLYDINTVTKLVRDEPELLQRRYVNGVKSEAWNVKIIRNCITQGILQGESIPEIAKRMARDTATSDMKAMTRYARTAMTGAQNAGRIEAMRESNRQGIYVLKVWLAVIDGRTRDAHIDLNGKAVPVNVPFKSEFGKIMYPGDPEAHGADIWNCRCALGYEYPDRAGYIELYKEYEGEEEEYEEWLEAM